MARSTASRVSPVRFLDATDQFIFPAYSFGAPSPLLLDDETYSGVERFANATNAFCPSVQS